MCTNVLCFTFSVNIGSKLVAFIYQFFSYWMYFHIEQNTHTKYSGEKRLVNIYLMMISTFNLPPNVTEICKLKCWALCWIIGYWNLNVTTTYLLTTLVLLPFPSIFRTFSSHLAKRGTEHCTMETQADNSSLFSGGLFDQFWHLIEPSLLLNRWDTWIQVSRPLSTLL